MSDTPDYSPTALEELKKKIAHMAIAFTLVETEWYGNAESGFTSGGFDVKLPPVDGPTGTIRITNTQSAGGWGGYQSNMPPPGAVLVSEEYDELGLLDLVYELDPWTDIYEPWITRIDDAFQGWEALPDPADYAGPVDSVRAAVTSLTPLPTGSTSSDPNGDFSDDFASVDLEANLDLLDDWIGPGTDGANSSTMIFAFDNAYGAGRIRPVLINQAQAGVVLGVTLLGEQRIWERAREDIMKLAELAEGAFDPFGSGGGFNLGVVKAFVDLLGHFVPPPLKPVLAVGGSALSLIEALLPPEAASEVESTISGGTAEDVYESMCDAITDLSRQITDRELELSTTLRGLLEVMDSGPGSQFHIHPTDGPSPEMLNAAAIDTHTEYLKLIGYQTVPRIAAVMGKAAEHAQAADKPMIWERTSGIGLGGSGPYTRWSAVLSQFDAVTAGSGAELVEAGRMLAVGAGFLEDVDGYAAAALKGVQDDLGRGEFGWDNNSVIPTPTGGWYMPF